jgi:hypothetical protein
MKKYYYVKLELQIDADDEKAAAEKFLDYILEGYARQIQVGKSNRDEFTTIDLSKYKAILPDPCGE